jgi:small-conductance mechanosensitive channel
MTTPSPTLAPPCSNDWQNADYCVCTDQCVLWSVPWEFLVISGVVLFLAFVARWIWFALFGLLSLILSRYGHPDWGQVIHRGILSWTVALFRCGMVWLAYVLLHLPANWQAVLNYIVPLPFIACTFFWVDVVFETATEISQNEFREIRKRGGAPASSTDSKASSEQEEVHRNAVRVVNTRATAWSEILRVLKYLSLIIMFLLGLAIEGVDIVNFLKSATLLGLILSFALQPWLRNLVGGMHVFADQKFVLGNRLRVGGLEGAVEAITLRTTTLRRDDHSVAYVPNSRMMDQPVTNCSARRHRLLEVRVALDRETPTAQVRALIRQIDLALQTLHPSMTAHILSSTQDSWRKFQVSLDGSFELLVRAYVLGENEAAASVLQSEVNLCIMENMTLCKVRPAARHVSAPADAASELEMERNNEDDNDNTMAAFAFFSVA